MPWTATPLAAALALAISACGHTHRSAAARLGPEAAEAEPPAAAETPPPASDAPAVGEATRSPDPGPYSAELPPDPGPSDVASPAAAVPEPPAPSSDGARARSARRGAGKGALYAVGGTLYVAGYLCLSGGPLTLALCAAGIVYGLPYVVGGLAAIATVGALVGAGAGAVAAGPAPASPDPPAPAASGESPESPAPAGSGAGDSAAPGPPPPDASRGQ